MNIRHASGRNDASDFCFFLCVFFMVCGALIGAFAGSERFSSAERIVSEIESVPGLLSCLFKNCRIVLAVALFGFSVVGHFLIPALCFAKGFSVSFMMCEKICSGITFRNVILHFGLSSAVLIITTLMLSVAGCSSAFSLWRLRSGKCSRTDAVLSQKLFLTDVALAFSVTAVLTVSELFLIQ